MTDQPPNQSDPSTLIADIENEIENLTDQAGACKKAMTASRVAILAAALLIFALLSGLFPFGPVAMTLGLAGFIGGIVWFGANRSTLLETQTRMKLLTERRTQLIDQIEMQVVEEEDGGPRGRWLH